MKRRALIPPLGVIESDLFGSAHLPEGPVDDFPRSPRRRASFLGPDPLPDIVELPELASLTLPGFLKDAIDRRVSARSAHDANQPLATGQIRRIDAHLDGEGNVLRTLARPVAFLLDKPTSVEGLWAGWLVASEVDYASAWDVLLESEVDEPFDPSAGMVQVWNPLQCRLAENAELLAVLAPDRLETVRAAADEFPRLPDTEKARPGYIAPRTIAGHVVLTGSPLGGADDERRPYQSLYFQLAREISEGNTANIVPLKPTSRRKHPGWMAIAASVVAVQAGIIGYLMLSGINDSRLAANRDTAIQVARNDATNVSGGISPPTAPNTVPPPTAPNKPEATATQKNQPPVATEKNKNNDWNGVRYGVSATPKPPPPRDPGDGSMVALTFSLREDARGKDIAQAFKELNLNIMIMDGSVGSYTIMVHDYSVSETKAILAPVAEDIHFGIK